MYRKTETALQSWMNNPARKPLLITGVRQCGKTYIMKAFGEKYYPHTAYVNLEKERNVAEIFSYDFNPHRIIQELGTLIVGEKIIPGQTLLILDEIQSCPTAITALKYFCEELPELHIMCAGSLLGVELKRQNIAFPVGKVDRLRMFPMSFYEFMLADGGEKFAELSADFSVERPLGDLLRIPLEKYYRNFLLVGGMPAVVAKWVETHDYAAVEQAQDSILRDYADDFSKHAPPAEVPKIHWVWDSVPKQLAKENNKFIFSHVKEGKRAAELENALIWLKDAGLVYQTELVTEPELPLGFTADATYFKVFMADVGLMRRKAGVYYKTILDGDESYVRFKGALAENYTHNELLYNGYTPYFWRSGNTAEVDFLIEHKGQICPIEVKAADNTMAKSYRAFCRRYHIPNGVKTSLKNLGLSRDCDTTTLSLPLYLLWDMNRFF